jgi:protein-disulfide isomerase
MAKQFVFILLVLAGGIGSSSVRAQDKDAVGKFMQRAATSRAKGVDGAPVLIYEIADFQCPFCAQFANGVSARLDSAYVKPGKVQWVFVNLPLPMHPNAWVAAEAAVCAGGISDRFWAMHDKLYANQQEWAPLADPAPVLTRYAREAGVQMDLFQACTGGDKVAPILLQDVIFAAGARVSGTPTFVINGEQTVTGVKTYDEWKDLIEKALLKPRPSK